MDQDRQNSQNRDTEHVGRDREFATYRTAQSSNDMVPTVFRRGIYRTIRGSLKRFLSIVVITALGVSVMCGLKAGCEDLCDSVDAYFDQQNVYDINVQSTYGLTRDDLAAIQEVDGVETAEGIYTETAYTAVGTTRERVVVQSLSRENIDQPVLVSGDLPERAGEVAVTSRFLKASGKKIGDTVSFAANDASSSNQSAKDQFAAGDYTITAEVLDPTDVSSDSTVNAFRAASAADYKFYVSEDAATSSSYSAVHVTVEGAKSLNSYSDAYTTKINEVKGNIDKIRDGREKARAQELTVDTPASLDAAERQANMLFGIEQDNIDRMAEGSEERAQAQADLDQRRAAADQQFADARAEISDLGECTWYIQDRGNIASYSSVESDSSSIEAIATVFPFIFFIVAVLISLTTATRMVEEERTLIGLYKALGYSRGRILSKYVDYALWACLIGGVLGNIIGFVGLPLFLFTVFDDMYSLPQMLLSYDIVSSIVSVALFAVGVVGATIIACRHEMAETPASLMRPKAPRAGSRILLERIKPLWSRMSFSWKVTSRNIFRYKRRFFMAIVGIAGCTALLLTGLGLQNAINDIIDKQFGEIHHYNMVVREADDVSDEDASKVEAALAASGEDVAFTVAHTENMLAARVDDPDGEHQRFELIVPEDPADFATYVTMRERLGHDPLTLDDDGVVISEKLAIELGLEQGDPILLFDEDAVGNATGAGRETRVAGIMENYVSQYAFTTPRGFDALVGEAPAYTTVYAKATEDEMQRSELSDELLAIDGVKTVGFNDETIESYRTMLKSVDAVVVVLVIAAAALAFVVLYNLTNINITERQREIATLKVLGFNAREVNAYIYRETLLLSAIGALVGCVLGVFMEGFVVVTAEVDQVMFGRAIHAMSFVIAFALTMFFSVLVTLFMRKKLSGIDMVESLKSVE